MLKPTILAWQNVIKLTFKLSVLTTAMASVGFISGCSTTPNGTNGNKTSMAKDGLLDTDSLDSLENLLYATDIRAVESDRLAILRHGDIWKRMLVGFKLNLDVQNPRINAQRSWFTSRQPYLDRLSARASRYLYYTVKEAERRDIPTELALLPIIESSYDPAATSSAAAAGLWQFIPSTGKIYGLRQSDLYDGRRDVVESTRAAYEYLSSLYNQFGSWELALASYNAGPGRIQQAINRNIAAGLPTDYWSLNLPQETMNYVPRFLAVAQIVKNQSQYGVSLPPIANRPHFREVSTPGAISLDQLAQITGISRGELYALNPGYRGNYTDQFAPHRILIPNEVSTAVDSKIENMKLVSGSGGFWTGEPAPLPTLSTTATSSTTSAASNTNILTSTAKTVNQTASSIKQSTPIGSDALAQFAASADTPSAPRLPVSIKPAQNVKQINIEPPISATEKQAILANQSTQTPATISTKATDAIVAQVVEPKPTEQERQQVIQELEKIAPKGTEIVDPLDGKIKLTAIQSSQSVAEQKGEDVKITYAYPKAVAEAELKANTDAVKRNADKPVIETPDEVVVVAPKGKRDVYTVQSGDTLANIATRYGINWRDIAKWNQINPDSSLYVGTRLYLYDAKPVKAPTEKPEKYVVKSGDTLTAIAQQFDLSLQDLAAWNNLSTNSNLLVGQRLTLIQPKNFKAQANSKTADIETITYTVKRGEYLKLIADRYAMSNEQLAALNKDLTPNSSLYVGQKIKVPKQEVKPTSTEQKRTDSKSGSNIKTTTYTVESGDYLSTVAKKFKMNLDDLATLNNLSNTSTIYVGQKLKVADIEPARPSSYKVQSGDTLTEIAAKFDMSVEELAALNDLKTTDTLKRGATLKLEGKAAEKTSTKQNSKKEEDTSNKASSSTSSFKGDTESYKVKSGESLTVIAARYNMSAAELADLNRISPKATLSVGQTLKVPKLTTTYKIKRGDTLIGLAKKYSISTDELAKMNDLKESSSLQLGQTLTVPNR